MGVVVTREGKMKIGVLGGTFDPIHRGHLEIAGEARRTLNLTEVILVPAGQPPFKPNRPITPSEQRLKMLNLAVANTPALKVSTIEIERPGPSYTADTLDELKGQYGVDDELFFILGWDSLEQIPDWYQPSRIIALCRLVAVPRPGRPRPSFEELESRIPGISRRVVFLEKPEIDISSSQIRELAAQGEPIEHLVPGPVAAYIREHGLYLSR
jgi:nicotinate-nucleotide adenylyltransferase